MSRTQSPIDTPTPTGPIQTFTLKKQKKSSKKQIKTDNDENNSQTSNNNNKKPDVPAPINTKPKKAKSITKASSLIRQSPRFSPTKKRKMKRPKSVDSYAKRRNQRSRTPIGTQKVSISSKISPVPLEEEEDLEINAHISPHRRNSSHSSHIRSKSKGRSSSVGFEEAPDDSLMDNALLKRLKSENKELRKSRNSLRKNHDILQKLESKLRHKLAIIAEKFQQIAIDFDDGTDWTKLQKLGIEAVLEAVFTKFGKITDQFVKHQKIWKEQTKKIKFLKNKWSKFVDIHFKDEGIEFVEDKEGIKDLKQMFTILNERFKEMKEEKDKLSDLVTNYKKKVCIFCVF